MHITLFKPGPIPIPPKEYGGTQRIIYWLAKAFMELGHKVTLIAHPESHIPGAELIPSEDTNLEAGMRLVPGSTDIIQMFNQQDPKAPKPFLVMVDGNGNGRSTRRFHPNTVFVSKRHAANHSSTHFIHNGLDPADYTFSEQREDYAVFLAKARWKVKNLHGAISVARRAGLELRVLGSRNWPFGLQRRLPAIRGVRYYGMVGGQEKIDLISRARCLIYPIRWEEPCAVALQEALVSGCYVVGTPYGCLPEIATPDVAVLSSKAADLAEAVRDPKRFQPAVCRDRILHGGLTHMDMARNYIACYEKILTHGSLLDKGETPAGTVAGFDPKVLLPWEN